MGTGPSKGSGRTVKIAAPVRSDPDFIGANPNIS